MTTYMNNTKGSLQKDTGTTAKSKKINKYYLFVGVLGLAEFILNYFGLQNLGGEQIQNGILFLLSIAISLAMAFSAHYAGETIRYRSKKASVITITLGIIFLFIVGYVRAVSNGSFILTLANLGFYGTIAYVSFLRAEHQPHFKMKERIKVLSAGDASIQSGIETEGKTFKHLKDSKQAQSRESAEKKVDKQLDFISDSIVHADHIIAQIAQYQMQRTQEIEDIKQVALNNCNKNNLNSNQ